MTLTDIERNIVQQVKSQGANKQEVIEILNQHRARQQNQGFQSLSQKARGDIDKSPEELLGVGSFKEDEVEVESEAPTLPEQLKERVEGTGNALFGPKRPLLAPEVKQGILDAIGSTEEGETTLLLIDQVDTLLDKIPGSQFAKDKITGKVDELVRTGGAARNIAGGINDVIGAGVTEALEKTGAIKIIEKLTDNVPAEKIGEVFKAGSEGFEQLEAVSPGLADILGGGGQLSGLLGFGKIGQVGKSGLSKTVSKIPTPSIKNQELAESLVNNVLKMQPNQKKKFRKENIGNGKTPAEYLLEKGLIQQSSSADDIVKGLEDLATTSKQSVDSSLASIKGTYKTESINDGIQSVLKAISDKPGLKAEVNRMNELKAKASRGEGLTLSEINEVKRSIDDTMNLFGVTGDLGAGTAKKGLGNIRNDIKVFIENEASKKGVDNIKNLNKDTQLSNELLTMLDNNLEAGRSNRLFGLTDVIVGSAGTLGIDPITGVSIVVAKKVAESDGFRLAVAKRLAEVTPDKAVEITKKIQSKQPLTNFEKILIGTAVIEAQKDIKNN